jgi:localization factor PodJL
MGRGIGLNSVGNGMASEASWQTSNAGGGSDAFSADQPMDQRTVESLLRRLVDRVEESERRYGEALDELHARLDQLSQTTEAARDTGAPEDADTFDRLHSQVSRLARRLEQDPSNPLEDFERLGKALSGGLRDEVETTTAEPFGYAPEPSPFAQAAMAAKTEPTPASGYPDFGYTAPEPGYAPGEAEPFEAEPFEAEPLGAETFQSKPSEAKTAEADFADLDKRLVDMAQRLEQSIGDAMPTSAIEALNRRLEEVGGQLAQALERAPTREALEHVERQISDMGQQLGRAEEQLGKVNGVEAHLLSLIERLDEKTPAAIEPAQLEEIANKAANEAARLVAGETKQNAERLDAMHRDLKTMSDKSRESGDRLVSTLEAVHESLKQLVQQVERGATFQARPRAPFMERARQAQAKPAAPQAPQFKMPMPQQPAAEPSMAQPAPAAKPGEASQAAAKERLRDRLGAAIPDFQEGEAPPPFGRAKRPAPGEMAVDLDTAPRGSEGLDAAPDDLVAAARRAAQAAAARAEERGGRRSSVHLPGSAPSAEQPGRRKRSLLIISAAVLLALSAILLYGRLSSKPDATPASTQQTTPAPAGNAARPQSNETAPANTPEQEGSWQPLPGIGVNPSDSAAGDSAPTVGSTDIAKSSTVKSSTAEPSIPPMPASELSPEPQLAALHPTGEAALPPGVIFSVQEPGEAQDAKADATAPLAMPTNLPLPPAALGPLPLRQAAAKGDPKAQYEIGVHYAEGVGTTADLKTAAEWFERAAGAGLAPAQYRLAAMYERGIGVEEDLGRARTWYAAAAEKGNIKAMHNLAVSVSGRDGSTPDYKLAAKWYAEAASYGLPDSEFNLAILAEHGLGMKKDPAEAYKWFSLAAAQGDTDAAKRREVIRVQLAPAALAKADAAVKAWKAKPAIAEANEVADNPAWAAKAPATKAVPLVSRAQTLLNKLGYDVGAPDGLIGPRTQSAIKLFQQRNGLAETGEVSIPLVTQLEHLSS